jgi:DUF4097 and DUF4098 domain-containing protein YvlB
MATSVPPTPTSISGTRRARRAWLFAGGILTPVALLLGTATVWSHANELATKTEAQHQSYRQPVSRIVLNLHDGDIRLTPGEDGQVVIERRLEWSRSKPTIEEKWAGNTLEISSRCARGSTLGLGSHCAVAYIMRVPPDVTIDARTVASRIDVRGLSGDLRLSESSGDVNLANTTGRLSVQTTSGDITGAGLRSGQVEVQATSGDIALSFTAGPQRLTATTGSGNVGVAVPGGDAYRVVIAMSGGDTNVTVRQDPGAVRTIDVRTSGGDIEIGYAS